MAQITPTGILLGNFLLGLEAFGSKFPNVMSKKLNSWNGRWVIQLGQVINEGRNHGFFNLAMVATVGSDTNQRFNEEVREDVQHILSKGIALQGNLQMVMQTVVDIHGALPGMALDKGIGTVKKVGDIFAKGWIEKLEKAKSYVENVNEVRKAYGGWSGGGVHRAIDDYTLLF